MASQQHGVPEVSFELDSFELVLLRHPDNPQAHDEATVKQIQGEHLAYLFQQQVAGKLKAAGAISNHPSLTGIGIYATGSLEEAGRLAEEDPAVEQGLDACEVMTLLCPRARSFFPSRVSRDDKPGDQDGRYISGVSALGCRRCERPRRCLRRG